MIIVLVLFFVSHYIHAAGFAGHTILLTKHGHTTFDEVDFNTLIQSHQNKFQPILFLGKQTVAKVVQLSIADELITCHKKQLFWCANKDDWVYAKDLLPGDILQTINEQQIAVAKINIIEKQTELYSLTVGPPHYLYVGKYNVLAHYMAWFVGIGIEFALECGTIEFLRATATFVIGAIALHFAKNKNKKKPKTSISIASSCKSPQLDPEDDNNDKDFFTQLKKKSKKSVRTKRFGKMYQDVETGLWWSKDLAQHGNSHFKVFKETAKSFEWIFNADALGNRIFGQHKGPVGMTIPYKEVIFKT